MPTGSTGERIAATVQGWEQRPHDVAYPPANPYHEPQPLRWMKLLHALAPAAPPDTSGDLIKPSTCNPYPGTNDGIDNANPAEWTASANSGKGGWSIDSSITCTVINTVLGMPPRAAGNYVLCRTIGTDNGMAWEPVAINQDRIRVRLTADWTVCEDGQGVEVLLDGDGVLQPTGASITLRDPMGIVWGNLLFNDDTFVIPSGTYIWAIPTIDGPRTDAGGQYYEPLNLGEWKCPGSGSEGSGSKTSGSETSGSETSGSEGSGSHVCCGPTCSEANVVNVRDTGAQITALAIDNKGQITGWWDNSNIWHSPMGCPEPKA